MTMKQVKRVCLPTSKDPVDNLGITHLHAANEQSKTNNKITRNKYKTFLGILTPGAARRRHMQADLLGNRSWLVLTLFEKM